MKTLIELYDERPMENVLAADVFHPERVVYLCERAIAQDKILQQHLRDYFDHRGLDIELVFEESSLYYTDKIARQILRITETYPDCVLDITGGTDAALFAAGQVSATSALPVFTYSRNRNRFYNIHNAAFLDDTPCEIQYSIIDFAEMCGGLVRAGRVDNEILARYLDIIDPFFSVFMKRRKDWKSFVTHIQRISAARSDGSFSLDVHGAYTVKGERGSPVSANPPLLRELQEIGLISNLAIKDGESVSFRFRDAQVRNWLRDVGSVLELYTYKACLDSSIFNDVRCSTVVDWENQQKADKVSNEIDVTAVNSVVPWFISCKVCDVDTDALNELSILRDRFGGEGAGAILISCEKCRMITRNRAQAMNIKIIDLDDLKSGNLSWQILNIIKS